MVGGHERAVLESVRVALLDETADLRVEGVVGQQAAGDLRADHLRVVAQDGARQANGVGDQLDVLVVHVVEQVLEVGQHRLQRQ